MGDYPPFFKKTKKIKMPYVSSNSIKESKRASLEDFKIGFKWKTFVFSGLEPVLSKTKDGFPLRGSKKTYEERTFEVTKNNIEEMLRLLITHLKTGDAYIVN